METDRKVHFQKKKKKEKKKKKKKKSRVGEPLVFVSSTSSVMACVLLVLSTTLHVVQKRILLHSCFGR